MSQVTAAEALAEGERLAYVAVTRACRQLFLVWARAAGQEGAPLTAWLFGASAVGQSIATLTDERLRQELGPSALLLGNGNFGAGTDLPLSPAEVHVNGRTIEMEGCKNVTGCIHAFRAHAEIGHAPHMGVLWRLVRVRPRRRAPSRASCPNIS